MTRPGASHPPASLPGPAQVNHLALAAVVLILTPLLARAMTPVATFPAWDFDPLMAFDPSPVGMGPAGSLVCDVLVLLGCGLGLLAGSRAPAQRGWRHAHSHGETLWLGAAGLLILSACAPLAFHAGLLSRSPDVGGGSGTAFFALGHMRIGAAWLSGMLAALALWRACRDPGARAVAFAVLMGFVIMLAFRGAQQVMVEHAATVADFQRNKSQIFAAQGWSADSPMARGYERRLTQNEASGWFGLANVFATFAAAGAVGFGGMAWAAWRARSTPGVSTPLGLMVTLAGAVTSLAAVAMAGAKGGAAAMVLGGVLCGAFLLAPRLGELPWLRRGLAWAPLAAVGLVLLGVVARGLVGLRSGELSLLFRGFYLQAAGRIALGFDLAGAHVGDWLRGVGPDGFKEAYLLAKNPLSPEEVSSPHSLLFDWWACLGLAGLAWAVVFAGLLIAVGRAASATGVTGASPTRPDDDGQPDVRTLVRVVVGIATAATFASIMLFRAAVTPSLAVVYLAGLGAWCVAGGHMVALLRRLPLGLTQAALAGAACVGAVHTQIEVTGVNPASAGLCLAMIAIAAARPPDAAAGSNALASLPGVAVARLLAGVAILLAGAIGLLGVLPAARWEGRLQRAAETVAPISDLRARMAEVGSLPAARRAEAAAQIAQSLSVALGRAVPAERGAIDDALAQLMAKLVPKAMVELPEPVGRLDQAGQAGQPGQARSLGDWRVEREVLRLATVYRFAAGAQLPAATPAGRRLASAIELAGRPQAPVSLVLSLAGYHEECLGDLTEALRAVESMLGRDPYNLLAASRRLSLLVRLASPEAPAAARRLLELDDRLVLDPLRRLSREQRLRAEGIAAAAGQ